jgi:hypothetical protein
MALGSNYECRPGAPNLAQQSVDAALIQALADTAGQNTRSIGGWAGLKSMPSPSKESMASHQPHPLMHTQFFVWRTMSWASYLLLRGMSWSFLQHSRLTRSVAEQCKGFGRLVSSCLLSSGWTLHQRLPACLAENVGAQGGSIPRPAHCHR